MAMLHIMAAIRQRWMPALSLQVAHFNHKIRLEADEEAQFVIGWAAKYNLPVAMHEMPADLRLKGANKSIQATAREWRRSKTLDLLNSKSTAGTGSGILTAHHAEDQVETILLKLLRGAHISRLHAILPRSECGSFVRPLLTLSKEQLRSYMVANHYDWREDSSNEDRKYKRNRVRLDVVPAMESIVGSSGSLKARLLTLSQQSLELRTWLRAETLSYLQSDEIQPRLQFNAALVADDNSKDDGSASDVQGDSTGTERSSNFRITSRFELTVGKTSRFVGLAPMVQSDVLHSICSRLVGTSVDYSQMKQLVSLSLQDLKNGARMKTIRISNDWVVTKIGRVLRFDRQPRRLDASPCAGTEQVASTSFLLARGISVVFAPGKLSVQPREPSQPKDPRDQDEGRVDLYNVPPASVVQVRYPKPGDVFQPPWRKAPIKVAGFLRSLGTPLHLREFVPVIVIDNRIAAVSSVVSERHATGPLDDAVSLRISNRI